MTAHFIPFSILTSLVLCGCASSAVSNNSSNKTERIALEVIPPLPSVAIPEDDENNSKAVTPQLLLDGETDNAKTIQTAIDSLGTQGGIIALCGKGTAITSPLTLKDNVYLKICEGLILKAVKRDLYPFIPNDHSPALISASNCSNTGVFGKGTVDGNGSDWWKYFDLHSSEYDSRPKVILFTNCTNVIVKDITVQNSAKFNLQPVNCKNVIFYRITISNPADSPNTDGIDPSSSDTVFIDSCTISTGDDNIALKSALGPSRNIFITNCTFGTGHGLSIGSETNTGIDRMLAANCTFDGTDNGIRIKTPRGRGGLVQNIQYSNMTMNNIRKYPFEISGYYPENTIPATGSDDTNECIPQKTPQIQNILVQDVTINKSKNRGGYIVGLPESFVKNVQLVHFVYSGNIAITVRNADVHCFNSPSGKTSVTPDFIVQENAAVQ
jgi:polygalacturonase